MSSYQALSDYINHHNLETDSVGNCFFSGTIDYVSPKKSIKVVSDIKLIRNGFEDGKIIISESRNLEVANFHLDFTPNWQEYEFSSQNGELIIKGSSPKMGGKYNIRLSPN